MKKNPPIYLDAKAMQGEGATAAALMKNPLFRGGSFEPRAHQGAGKAEIIQKAGKVYLVFDDAFKTDPGPLLHVFLSAKSNPQTSSELHSAGVADLGLLKNPRGAQTYEITPDKLGADWKSVIIYCVPFKVLFALAELK